MENNSFLSTVLQKLVSQPAHAALGTQSDAGRAAPGDLRTLDPWTVEDLGETPLSVSGLLAHSQGNARTSQQS